MVLSLYSPDQTFDELFVSNFVKINVRDALFRIPGVGDVFILGEREYGMRLWVDPDKLYRFGMTPADVVNAVQEQNIQAAAGKIGQPPNPPGQEIEYTIKAKGRLKDPRSSPTSFCAPIPTVRSCASPISGGSSSGRMTMGRYRDSTPSLPPDRHLPVTRRQCHRYRGSSCPNDAGAEQDVSQGAGVSNHL